MTRNRARSSGCSEYECHFPTNDVVRYVTNKNQIEDVFCGSCGEAVLIHSSIKLPLGRAVSRNPIVSSNDVTRLETDRFNSRANPNNSQWTSYTQLTRPRSHVLTALRRLSPSPKSLGAWCSDPNRNQSFFQFPEDVSKQSQPNSLFWSHCLPATKKQDVAASLIHLTAKVLHALALLSCP
jgi:hypothetical protein